MSNPNPKTDAKGIPWCTDDGCPLYDGKRCRATGFKPSNICEPAVEAMAEKIKTLETDAARSRGAP